MRKFLQPTTRTRKIKSFFFFPFAKVLQFSMVTDEQPPAFKYSFNWLHWVLVVACMVFSCGMWNLVPSSGTEPGHPVLGAQNLSLWTSREFCNLLLKKDDLFTFGCAGSLLLCGLFSGCGARGLLSCFCAELPPLVAALAGKHRL